MIKSLFDSGVVYIIVASIAGLGLIFRMMELMAFLSMVSKKDKKEKSNGKRPATFLTFLKTDYTKKYLTGKKVNNVDAFVDKHMINREFCGLSITTYRKICGLITIITVTSTLLFSVLGGINLRGQNEILSTFLVGIICTALLISVDCLIGFEDRMKRYRASFASYIENEYFYYISGDENVQKAAMQTVASRQKKILMEEKENALRPAKEFVHEEEKASQKADTSEKKTAQITDCDEKKMAQITDCDEKKVAQITDCDEKRIAKINDCDEKKMTQKKDYNVEKFSASKETVKNGEISDEMLIDEILKGILAQ